MLQFPSRFILKMAAYPEVTVYLLGLTGESSPRDSLGQQTPAGNDEVHTLTSNHLIGPCGSPKALAPVLGAAGQF